MEMEVISIQNMELKSQQLPQHSQHFWSLIEPDDYKDLHHAALKSAALFGLTYLSESASSDMSVIKPRTRLTDEHLNDSIRVNQRRYIPAYSSQVESMQRQSSTWLELSLESMCTFWNAQAGELSQIRIFELLKMFDTVLLVILSCFAYTNHIHLFNMEISTVTKHY